MNTPYWHKQNAIEPLFPDLLWSRPENKARAGKLLIVGGNLHGFAAPAQAYAEAVNAGIGTAKVLLPDAIKKLTGPFIAHGEFAPSTKHSGSFSKAALAEFYDHSAWADGVLLTGELGRNSETAALLERYLSKVKQPLTITHDALEYFYAVPSLILDRPQQTCLVMSLAQLQKLAMSAGFTKPIKFSMDLLQLIEALHQFSQNYSALFIVKHLNTILVAYSGQVGTTKLNKDLPVWRVKTAAYASVWTMQNPIKPFEAAMTAVYQATA